MTEPNQYFLVESATPTLRCLFLPTLCPYLLNNSFSLGYPSPFFFFFAGVVDSEHTYQHNGHSGSGVGVGDWETSEKPAVAKSVEVSLSPYVKL